MAEPIVVVERFVQAAPKLVATGLRFFASVRVGPLRITGVQVRVSLDSRWIISWPAKDTKAGRRVSVVAPIDPTAARLLEAEILKAIPLRDVKSESVP